MAKSDGCAYFKRTSLFWIITVTLAMAFFTGIVFVPEKLPLQHLGVFGSLCSHLVENYSDLMYKGWLAAWAVHIFEALVALRTCSAKGISSTSVRCLWFVQTFLFGFASLGLLLKYDPERPKHH
ncbi:transmembrane protein 254 [Parambassis ranga]|uniref:Transmembrane protein 254 n=1 Tax=Parambassis ranga TaxID=210632 RepID=A0A6P7JQZ4_9TELE|nr:transmembrane protein 254 [Parambassis ranga]